MKPVKILVAMSGGVDSSVAAALLKEEGYEVGGATIRTWAPNDCENLNTRACCGLTGVEDSRRVAEDLDIPYWVFNMEKAFKEHVIDYFAAEYMQARTPNPCIACNEHIKFRLFLKRALQLGFDGIATGHYAQIVRDESGEVVTLAEGHDTHKDQSYVLFPLDREILKHLYLPCGGYTKDEIRAKARELGLSVSEKPDSQEICFIPSNDYGAFLNREYGEKSGAGDALDLAPRPGSIVMRDGTVLGEHEGYFNYTVGQRRGLGVAYSEKLYVVNVDAGRNEVIVGTKEDVLGRMARIGRVNWFLEPVEETLRVHVKIRSQHQKAAATLNRLEGGDVEVVFDEAQEAITPGQGAVFYEGPKVIGGGWIDSRE